MGTDEPKFLTLNEVAERYRVTYPTVYDWVATGRLPAFQIGGRGKWRVSVEELRRVEAGDVAPATDGSQ